MFVAESANTLVGTAGWAGGYLRHVHIRPGFERCGIGRDLVRHVEAAVGRSTCDTEIRVNATRNAEGFHVAVGFERLYGSPPASPLFILMRTTVGREDCPLPPRPGSGRDDGQRADRSPKA